jgi:MFS family permease
MSQTTQDLPVLVLPAGPEAPPRAPVLPKTTPAPLAPAPPAARRLGYRDVFALREYRGMFVAEIWSALGDQLAAVAVAVLLYERSGSPLLAAAGYATVYLPWTVGGPLLAAYAERLPVRRVMVGCDVLRGVLFGLAALPGLPLLVVGLLVLAAAFLAPPFESSASALKTLVLPDGERYALALSVRSVMVNTTALTGFAVGGVVVAIVTARGALAIDAMTFVVSAVLLRVSLQHRPAASSGAERKSLLAETVEGLRLVAVDRRRYAPLLLAMAGAAYIEIPAAIATVYAATVGYGPTGVGLILASVAGGNVVGAVLIGRFVSTETRNRLMWPMALAGTVPLMAVAAGPGLVGSLVLFALAGICSSFQVAANTKFAGAVPRQARGRAFGIAMTGLCATQVVAVLAAGALAQIFSPSVVVAGGGVLGALAIVGLRRVSAASTGQGARHLRVD